ncbi:MAG TPA: hypothetical protein VNO35_11995 [Steroidobacteraceae bacterium]|nr:hypothetical protein [Steroidobacteraceae bacterium]
MRPTDAPWQMNVSRTKRLIGSPADFLNAVQLSRGWIKGAAGEALGLVPAREGRVTQGAARRAATRYLTAGLVAAAVAAAIVAVMPVAHAQDAPTATQTPSAPASSSTPSSSAPASSSTTSATTPASDGQAAGGQSGGSKADPVCFQLTGHCVDSSKAPGKKAGSAAAKSGTTGRKPLNLTAPDISTVVPEQDLKEPLPNTEQITETQESDTVSVKGEQGVPPEVPMGLGSIWWAVSHPSQAWRILTPE